MAIGASAGFTNGFVSGTGNSLIAGNKLGSALGNGMKMGIIQGGTGALLGGIAGGIRANSYGGDFWTGKGPGISSSGRAAFNAPQFKNDLSINGNLSEIKSLQSGAELHFTDNTTISIYNNYYDGSQKFVGSYNSWSGGINPGPETQWGGMTPSGSWSVTNIKIDNTLSAPYVRDGVGFVAQMKANFTLPSAREAGTFYLHPDGYLFPASFGSNGCPVLQCGANDLKRFAFFIEKYIKRNGPLQLYVYH